MNFWLTAMLNLIVASPLCQWPCVEWVQRANGFVNTKSFLLVRRSRSMASVGSAACDIGAPPSLVGLVGCPGRSPYHVKWVQLDWWVGITVPHLLVGLLVDRDALFDGGITSLSVALG